VWENERQWDKWDKNNCMICTNYLLEVGGELGDSGTDGTKETLWFVLITVKRWVLNWRLWERWDKRNCMVCTDY
jgi:hypothetical protein